MRTLLNNPQSLATRKGLTMARDLYAEVTNRILLDMEQGVMPWEKTWDGSKRAVLELPSNATTKRPYRGINVLLLWGLFPDARFLTFKQALDCGGSVKKGEHGFKIYFYKPLTVKDKDTGEDREIPMLREYTVFHISQTEGCKFADLSGEAPQLPDDTTELTETIGAIVSHGGDRACYSSSLDRLAMPFPQDFKAIESYRATLYHELTHWTGHKSRLDRNLKNRHGSSEYAREELVAELGGAFLCAEYGLPYQTQHASYLANWLQVLKDDKRAILQAASAAQKSVDHIRQLVIGSTEPLQIAA